MRRTFIVLLLIAGAAATSAAPAIGGATTTTTVVTGSGTGELVDIRGEGSTSVGHDGAGTYSFDYELG